MPTFQRFSLPDVGEGLTEAEIVSWAVRPGDTVTVNQPVCEIETAKSLVELPCPWDGVVAEVLVPEGQTVEVGTPILVVDVAGDAAAAGSAHGGATEVSRTADEDAGSGAVLVGYGTATASPGRRRRRASGPSVPPPAVPAAAGAAAPVLAKPPVRKLAKDLGVDLAAVRPSGAGGVVTRGDVLAAAGTGAAPARDTAPAPAPAAHRTTRIPVRGVRKRTADAMVASAFAAPHVTLFHTVDVTATMDLVARLKQDRELADVRVTPLVVVMKALILAVRRHPEINAAWDEQAQEIVQKHYVNLGIAASTDRGLLVPNIKDAHAMTLPELAGALEELTRTAREGRTPPEAMTDGTITITNVGVFGTDTGTPILNPGEAAILAFGAVRRRPWVVEDRVEPRWVTQLALSVDHRVVDGDLAAAVLADVARVLEDPARGLVWA